MPYLKELLVFIAIINFYLIMEDTGDKRDSLTDDQDSVEVQHRNENNLERCHRYYEQFFGQNVYKSQIPHIFSEKSKREQLERKEKIKLLAEKSIEYDQSQFINPLRMVTFDQSYDHQIMVLKVSYGYFRMLLTIINVPANSMVDSDQIYSTKVKYVHLNTKSVILKRFPFQNRKNSFTQWFKIAVKEVFMLRIASVLKTGPQQRKLGHYFDIVVYNNAIEFGMEKCQLEAIISHTVTSQQPEQLEQMYISQLREALRVNHMFGIIHHDIKNDNVGYSKIYKRFVLIDFDLSILVREKVGELSKAFFAGTVAYSSSQVFEIMGLSTPRQVDLYYNDVHCLNVTFSRYKLNMERALLTAEERQLCYQRHYLLPKDLTQCYKYMSFKGKIFFQGYSNVHKMKKYFANQTIEGKKFLMNSLYYHAKTFYELEPQFRLISSINHTLFQSIHLDSKRKTLKQRYNKVICKQNYCECISRAFPSMAMCQKMLKKQRPVIFGDYFYKDQQEVYHDGQREQHYFQIKMTHFAKTIAVNQTPISLALREMMCHTFLKQNQMVAPNSSKSNLQNTLLFLYKHSVLHKDPSIMKYCLPSVILMELVSTRQFKIDMEALFAEVVYFEHHPEQFIKRAELYVDWMIGLKWINSKIPGIYDCQELENILFSYMDRDINRSTELQGRAKIMQLALKKVQHARNQLGKYTILQLNKHIESITQWFSDQQLLLVHDSSHFESLEAYILSLIWTLFANLQQNHDSLLRTLMRVSTIPSFFASDLNAFCVEQRYLEQSHYYSNQFRKYFGQYKFYPRLRLVWSQQIRRVVSSGKTAGSKLKQWLVDCQKDGLLGLELLSMLAPAMDTSLSQIIFLWQTTNHCGLDITIGINNLLQGYPLQKQKAHFHQLASYLKSLSGTSRLFVKGFNNIQSQVADLRNYMGLQSCKACKQAGQKYFSYLQVQKLIRKDRYNEGYSLALEQYQSNSLAPQQKVDNLMYLFQLWKSYKSVLPNQHFSSLFPSIQQMSNPSVLLTQPQIFTHMYCHFLSREDPLKHVQSSRMIEFVLNSIQRSTLMMMNLAYAISQSYIATSEYGIDDDSFAFTQLQIAFMLKNKKSPQVGLFIIIVIYNYYARGQPMKEYLSDQKIKDLLYLADSKIKQLPSQIRSMVGAQLHDLMCYYQTGNVVGLNSSIKKRSFEQFQDDQTTCSESDQPNYPIRQYILPRKMRWYLRKSQKAGLRLKDPEIAYHKQPLNEWNQAYLQEMHTNMDKVVFWSHQLSNNQIF